VSESLDLAHAESEVESARRFQRSYSDHSGYRKEQETLWGT